MVIVAVGGGDCDGGRRRLRFQVLGIFDFFKIFLTSQFSGDGY